MTNYIKIKTLLSLLESSIKTMTEEEQVALIYLIVDIFRAANKPKPKIKPNLTVVKGEKE